MKRTFFVLIFAIFVNQSIAQQHVDGGNYQQLIDDLQERIPKGLGQHDIPGLSIALFDQNGVIWQKGFGYTDMETEKQATSETIYRAGSLSKILTSVAVMQLVEQGHVHLDSSLNHYLPDFSMKSRFGQDRGAPTIRQLLTHYAGLPANYIKGILDEEPKSLHSYVNLLSDQYYAFRPNTVYCYSGTGYSLLGLLIEEISGKTFPAYMKDEILNPLRMRHSAFRLDSTIKPRLASGYLDQEKRKQVPIRDVPAGGLYSNVKDLAHFGQMALQKGQFKGKQIIRSSSFNKLIEPQNGDNPYDFSMRIGLGWKLDGIAFTYGKNLSHLGKIAGHGGQTVLFRSKMMLALEHDVGVVIMTNSSNGKDLAWPLASEVLEKMAAAKSGVELANKTQYQSNVSLDGFPQSNKAYYATRWGVMSLNPKNNSTRIRATLPDRNLLLKQSDDGGYDVRYIVLGLLPIKVNQLNKYHFGFVRKDSMDMMVRTSEGMTKFFGNRVEKDTVPDVWQARTGEYQGKFTTEEVEVIKHIKIYMQEGFLMMNLDMPLFTDVTLRLALDPISPELAYIKGHSRFTGDVLKFVEENGQKKLIYAGLPLIKQE